MNRTVWVVCQSYLEIEEDWGWLGDQVPTVSDVEVKIPIPQVFTDEVYARRYAAELSKGNTELQGTVRVYEVIVDCISRSYIEQDKAKAKKDAADGDEKGRELQCRQAHLNKLA